MIAFEHPRQLFSFEYPEGWNLSYREDTGSVILLHGASKEASGLTLQPLLDADARSPVEALLESARRCGVTVDPGNVRTGQRGEVSLAHAEGESRRMLVIRSRFRFWVFQRGPLSLLAVQLGPGTGSEAVRRAVDEVLESLTFPEILPPSPEEFRDRVIEVLTREYTHVRAAAVDPWVIELRDAEDEVVGKLGLENLYRRCLLSAESAGAIIREHLDQTLSPMVQQQTYSRFEAVRDRLLPMLKPEDWVQDASAQLELARVPFATGLFICFAVDEPGHVAYVSESMVEEWGVPLEQIQGAAQDNLARKSEAIELAMLPGKDDRPAAIVVNVGDAYDATRIILPDLRELFSEHLGDEYLAGVPNRDFLIVFSQRDPEIAGNIIRQVKADYQRMNHPVSPTIYRVRVDTVEPTDL